MSDFDSDATELDVSDGTVFGLAADLYERARPTYPAEAAAWLVPRSARVVVDLGAGTGKFTRALVERGFEVIAVEPDSRMLATLTASLPSVTALVGSAERLPLGDATVDAVTVAQAWHWVDESAALPEIARVLKPGATLGLIWNVRDERVDWVRRLGIVMRNNRGKGFRPEEFVIGAPFGPTEYFSVDWSLPCTAEALVNLAASRSYVITAEPAERQSLLAAVRKLTETHPDLVGRERFWLPYRTHCYRATRL